MRTVHQCRIDTLAIQKNAKIRLEKIMSLNPMAKTLRTQLTIINTQLAVAIATMNKPLIATLTLRRHHIRSQQRILNRTQQAIIREANIRLSSESLNAYYNLKSLLQKLASEQRSWSKSTYQILPLRIPKLAVRPSDNRIAPTYELKKDFERKQAVSLFWIQHYDIKGWLKSNSLIKPQVRNECHATLEEDTWTPKIRKDKHF